MTRLFNKSQKTALYIFSGGACSNCGAPLEKGWHADHVTPHSKGGRTHVLNGQALCSDCNLKKGATMPKAELKQWTKPLRDWQQEFQEIYFSKLPADFLLVATPGAGKTTAALSVAHALLRRGDISRIVVVTPTDHIRKQWDKAASKIGIDLTRKPDADETTVREFHGLVVTYHQVAFAPQLYAKHSHNALVIFDELHHLGDVLTWGEAAKIAFSEAPYRLALSGTPFRSDNNAIPFVTYIGGRSIADYTYGYGRALRDGVCRHIIFPAYDGDMEWMDGGAFRRASFADVLSDDESRRRLRVALSPKGQWIPKVLDEAHKRLMAIRNHPDPAYRQANAGGLVIAPSKRYAEKYADELEDIVGQRPVVVTSDNPAASTDIDLFKNNTTPWLVAVKMVSEGVDIPRLRVGVYATNVSTPMAILQAIGRYVRVIDDMPDLEDQTAYLFFPHAPEFLPTITTVTEERDHYLKIEDEEEIKRARARRMLEEEEERFWEIGSSAARHVKTYYQEGSFSPDEIAEAQIMAKDLGFTLPAEKAALWMRRMLDKNRPTPVGPIPAMIIPNHAEPNHTKFERMKTLRTRAASRANLLAIKMGVEPKEVHIWWIQSGGKAQKEAGEEELQRKIAWIDARIDRLKVEAL